MKREEIGLISEEMKIYDKKDIALAIKNSTYYDEIGCSLLDDKIIKNCDVCSLKGICEVIDKISDEYVQSTTNVVNSFTF